MFLYHFPLIPPKCEGCNWSISLTTLVSVFNINHSSECAVVSHCGFICIILMTNNLKHFLTCLLVTLGGTYVRVLAYICTGLSDLLLLCCRHLLYILKSNLLSFSFMVNIAYI